MIFAEIITSKTLNIASVLGVIVLIFSFYFSLHLFFQKEKPSNKFLSLYFFLFSLNQIFSLVFDLGFQDEAYLLIGVFIATRLSMPPVFYLYLKHLIGKSGKKLIVKHLWLPIFVGFIDFILIIIALNFSHLLPLYFKTVVSLFTIGSLFGLSVILNFYYLILSYKNLKSYRIKIGDYFSFEEGVNLKWINSALIGYVFLSFINIAEMADMSEWLFYTCIIAYIGYTGYKGIGQASIFKTQENNDLEIDNTLIEANGEVAEPVLAFNPELYERIITLMRKEQLFLKNDLTIIDISKLLKVNSKYISLSIHSGSNCNFATFINSYRIEYAKKLLSDATNDNLTIEGIGNISGFKSKSAFNISFKKQTGKTPSEYKNFIKTI